MFDLDKLWRKRLRVILQSIAAGERSHREIASIASHIGAEIREKGRPYANP